VDLNRLMICETDPHFVRDHPGRLVNEGLDAVMDGGYGLRPCIVFLHDLIDAKTRHGVLDPAKPPLALPFLLRNTTPDGNCLIYATKDAVHPTEIVHDGIWLSHRTGVPYYPWERQLEQEHIFRFRIESVNNNACTCTSTRVTST
jgi:hypothetical protein